LNWPGSKAELSGRRLSFGRAEGLRDTLLRELQDNTGAHDQRAVAVR